jgi:hypothetical protein
MLLFAAALAFLLTPQNTDTTPPAKAQAVLTAVGHGVQIYRCTTPPAETNTLQWVLQGPEADLFDQATKQPVGTHTAGPTWTWADGSSVTGKVIASDPSPDASSLPWLLLEAHASAVPGALAKIRFIRRTDTQAGIAPAGGCDAQHHDNTLRVPYQATYTFYTAP